MEYSKNIESLAEQVYPQLVDIRRHLHKFPELSGSEKNTASHICAILDEWKIPYRDGIGGYGIVALIEGKSAGACVALRADMDALSIQEISNCEYKSAIEGVMHACGHDAHIASLLGTAFILNTLKDSFSGSFKLIFQPSEEKFPGGAIQMIQEGVLENPKVNAIIGQHVLPGLSTGSIGLKSGPYMASTDEIYITVTGRGGHGATPELNIDPVVIASQIIVALQQITSRVANPSVPTVLSFGRMIADGRTNIIPEAVTMEGTIRTFDEKWRAEAHKKIISISKGIAEGFGAKCIVDIHHGYPFLVNDEKCTDIARRAATSLLGRENVVELPLRMTAEDFAYYAQNVPAIFYRLGITDSKTKEPAANLHTASFDIDEKSLITGCSCMAKIAIDMLSELNNKHL
ncbi:MAG: N-acyl-L-amino acid amidohydrolase [Bacteroidetes bacterium GWF2_43_63]|nr:MAG: N-acyl-L-amino acid amidohydrolase [Bacteroidetes bacterium GWE2_42_42]OFY54129.1 MAG: N-acyl-L-amino acid amidohydrolase [Bacteroidetes bacterium GWF2_43_63]HBG70837.1 amidohydrolase [Bacteroidales bacterium]HCB61740.1 amidohydrolase [Bacteroidales bacterium]HCY22116.1 amidohydrolase [Bacteroidales bacterium]